VAVGAHTLMSVQARSLYPSVLGPDWNGLPPIVRRLHEPGSATGPFSIRRGAGPLSALIGWLCRFPAAGESVPTRLVVRQEGEVQHWERTFGGHSLGTVQRALEAGRMGEKLGPVECVFRLRVVEGGLAYEQVAAWLCVGPWRLPLPRLLAPRIEGLVTEAAPGMKVRVRIGTAFTGWLLTYEGLVSPQQEESP
jgi:hypothetical protein